jgi:hypothetical protein
MISSANDRRAEKRDTCSVKVEYCIDSSDCANMDCGPWVNVTSDLSYSGMGLYSAHPVRKGQKLKIFLNHISSDPITARAKWCIKLNDEIFRIGIIYESAS